MKEKAVGAYRLWRDAGYAFGALPSGVIADLLGLASAVAAIGALRRVDDRKIHEVLWRRTNEEKL